MEIYNNLGVKVLDIPVDDTSYRYRAIMGDNSLTFLWGLTAIIRGSVSRSYVLRR